MSKKQNDEITIDFSKIKNLFSKAKQQKKKVDKDKTKLAKDISSEMHTQNEIKSEIDKAEKQYVRIKSETIEDEISFDFDKAKKFIFQYSAFFLILIPIILTLMIRLQTNDLPVTDSWAQGTVNNYFQSQIRAQIDTQYPNLPDTTKSKLVSDNYAQYYTQNKAQIDAQAQQISQQYKQYFKDDNGYTYLSDIDSYMWLRQADNILKKGTVADKIVDGMLIDDHGIAPIGLVTGPNIHPYAIAYLYPVMKLFSPNMTLMQTSFYVPVIIAILSSILAFFIGRRIAGNVGGLFASIILAINPMFITRTYGSDNDIWNVFFPLLVFWLILEAFEAESMKKRMIFSSLSGIANGVYAFAWGGWWYTFDVLLATLGVYFAYYFVLTKNIKSPLTFFKTQQFISWAQITIPYIFFTGLFVTLILGFSSFIMAPISPLSFVSIKDAVHASLWPNVYTTVAELNPGNLDAIISNVGGKLFFFIAAFGILLTMLKKDEHGHFNIKHAVLLLIWFIGATYSTYKGIRFIFLIIPAFAIAFGVAFGLMYQYISRWLSKEISLSERVSKALVIIALLLFILSPVKASYDIGKGLVPTMNDPWYQTLSEIKEKSQPNAIINSWWDFGHWFKAVADRSVTFDGASQNLPQAHWIGKVLSTDDEDLAMRILRMLDCGANKMFEEVDKKIGNTRKSVEIVYDVLENQGKEKEVLARYGFTSQEADGVLKYLLCNPPEDYFIASEDMIGKAGVWAHFGSWDFKRAEIWLNLRQLPREQAVDYMVKEYNFTKDRAESTYDEVSTIVNEDFANSWIASWPNYISGVNACRNSDGRIYCENTIGGQYVAVNISLDKNEAIIPTTNGVMHPTSMVYSKNNKTYEIKFNDSTLPYSIIIISDGENYANLWSQPQIANSMFTRLFFFDAAGTEHFKLFTHKQGLTGTNIYTYKIDWEGKNSKK